MDTEDKNFLLPDSHSLIYHPALEVPVDADFNLAVESLLDACIDSFIMEWYPILPNSNFVSELKQHITYSLRLLLHRFLRMNKEDFLHENHMMLLSLFHHIHTVNAHKVLDPSATPNTFARSLIAQCFHSTHQRSHLHISTYSRHFELLYLRHLCHEMISLLCPTRLLSSSITLSLLTDVLSCRVFLPLLDLISQQDSLYQIVYTVLTQEQSSVIHFDEWPSSQPVNHHLSAKSSPTSLLKAFSTSTPPLPSRFLTPNFHALITSQENLFIFINFMKREKALCLIKFYLAFDNLFSLLITDSNSPSLSSETDIVCCNFFQIYENFFSTKTTPQDCIYFDKEIVRGMHALYCSIKREPINSLHLLRTSPAIYSAHNVVTSFIDRFFLPLFSTYSMYLKSLVKLEAPLVAPNKKKNLSSSFIQSNNKGELFRILNQKAPKASLHNFFNYEDQAFCSHSSVEYEEDFCDDSIELAEEGSVEEECLEMIGRDLSNFSVSIDRVENKIDSTTSQPYFAFIISVSGASSGPHSSWSIERKYHEFYVLESKLVEFHGPLLDACLPPKEGRMGVKELARLYSKCEHFQNFLKSLITHPKYKRSQLLYRFLTSSQEFNLTNLEHLNLGRIIKNVPMLFLLERGQNLHSFLKTFSLSLESPSSSSLLESEGSMDSTKSSFHETIFNDPSYVRPEILDSSFVPSFFTSSIQRFPNSAEMKRDAASSVSVNDSTFYEILFILTKMYCLPEFVVKSLLFTSSLVKLLVKYALHLIVNEMSDAPRIYKYLTILCRFLKGVVVSKSVNGERSHHHDAECAPPPFKEAINRMLCRKLAPLSCILPANTLWSGNEKLLHIFQYPILNKQLIFNVIDHFSALLFSELRKG